jgi:hypothetical protein
MQSDMHEIGWEYDYLSDTKNERLHANTIGGAHQQTSERVVPPVSVDEKGKATDKKKLLLFLLMSIQY